MSIDIHNYFDELLGSLRTLIFDDGSIWFLANDVTEVLGYSGGNNGGKAIVKFVDENDRKALYYKAFSAVEKAQIWTKPNDFSNKWIISEYGLYDLLMRSEAPNALSFQRWVTHEVLPSIRRNGGYILGQENLLEEEKEILQLKIKKLASDVARLQKRRHAIIAEREKAKEMVRNLKASTRYLKRENKALNDYADHWEKMYDNLFDEYEELLNPSIYKKFPTDRGVRYSVSSDGLVSF